jgi:putative exosortase-associated protein (TIGR04073 family)
MNTFSKATRFGWASALVLMILVLASPAPAEGPENSPARKAGRGLAAMTCGFLELPGNIVKETRERNAAWGFTLGFAKGLGGIVVRELVGVYELLSAPFEAPGGYEPIIQPEFPWDYFDEESPEP